MGGKRKPKIAFSPEQEKVPRHNSMEKEKKPGWHFGTIDWDGNWGWGDIKREQMEKVVRYLGSIEQNTWHEIIGGKNHSIPVQDIHKDAKKRLLKIKQDDIDDLISLRIEGKYRIWGIIDRNILKILWHDPNHTVYPVEKKNT